MTAIVTGASLGLNNSSLKVLGQDGEVGTPALGASGEQVYVNSTTGNLVVQRKDEILVGLGNDISVVRTYNSQGLLDGDNNDNWRIGLYKRVYNLTGTAVNTAGSTITRVDGDGSELVYRYDTTLGKYTNTDGDGAFDSLSFNSTNNLWTWSEGSTQVTEEYDGANGGRIIRSLDTDGNAYVYTYNASGLITQIGYPGGETVFLDYTGSNLTQIRTVKTGNVTVVRTLYAYDTSNRLVKVTTDLSPDDASVADANTYVINYTYDGTSKRVASITQTDGNNLSFLYDASGRVASFTDANGKVTTITYTQGSASVPMSASANNAVLSTTESQTANYTLNTSQLTTPPAAWSGVTALESSSNAASQLSMGAANNGDAVAAWLQNGSIYASTYDTATHAWSAPVLVSGAFTNISGVQLSVDHQFANAIVTWIDATTGANKVYAARGIFNGTTMSWGAAQLVVTTGTGVSVAEASGAINGNGASTVIWRTVNGTTIALSASTYSGSTWGAAASVTSGTVAITAPQVVVTEAGIVQVLWRASSGGAESLFTRGKSGTTWSAATLLESSTTPVSLLRMDTDIYGDANILWVQGNNINNRWGTLATFQPVVTRGTSTTTVTELAYSDSSGNMAAAWLTSAGDLYAFHYSSGVTQKIVTGTGLAEIGVDVNANGDAIISWRQGNDLYASRFAAGGTAWTAPELMESASGAAATPRTSVSDIGESIAVWQQNDGTANSIFASRYLPGGGGSPYYIVQANDTWQIIGQKLYGSTTVASALQSQFGSSAPTQGAQLTGFQSTLQGTTSVTVAPYYTVQTGDTWTSITENVYGTSDPNAVAALQASPGMPAAVPAAGTHLTMPQTLNYSVPVTATVSADITDPLGLVTSLFYDGTGQLIRALTPAVGGTARLETRYTYDASGNVTQVTDGKGNVVTYSYDAKGNRILERDAAGSTITRTYGTKNELLTETSYVVPDPDGAGAGQPGTPLTTRYVYDTKDHLRFVVCAEGRVTEYRYDGPGNRIAAIQYTATLYSLTGLNPGDALTEAQLTSWLSTVDKSKSVRVDSTYDFRGQLDTTKSYASVDVSGNGVVNGTEAVRKYIYDQAGNLLKVTDPRGVATTAVPDDFTTTYVYDGLGRVLSTLDATGRSTVTVYQDGNRKTVLTLANGLVTTSTYDAVGNVFSVLQSSGATTLAETKYFYDADRRLRRIEDPTGVTTHVLYDEAGRKIADIDGDGSLTEYRYDAAGNLTRTIRYATPVSAASLASLKDASGNPTNVTLATIRPTGTGDDRSSWNTYDAANRLAKSVDELGFVTERIYDGADRLSKVVRYWNPISTSLLGDTPAPSAVAPTASATNDRVSRKLYDAEGKLVGTLDAEGYLVEYKYDTGGELVETVGYATATSAAQWAAGTLAQLRPTVVSPDDIHSYTLYNVRGQVAGTVDGQGYLTEYVYDAAGNRTQVIRYDTPVVYTAGATVASLRPLSKPSDQASSFAYDALNRVTSQTAPDGTVTQKTYDEVGNLTTSVEAYGTDPRTLTTQYDKQGRVTAELSAKGASLLIAGLTQAQIDAIWAANAVKYTYDAAGRRTSSIDANGKRTLLYYNADGNLTHRINAFGEVTQTVYNALGQAKSTIAYGTRLSATTLSGLSGGLVNATLTAAIQGIANATLDSKTDYTYNVAGGLTQKNDPLGNAVTQALNAFGEVASSAQALGDGRTLAQAYTYDRRGLLKTTVSDQAGINATTSTDYDAFGRAYRTTDARGNVTTQAYDRLGRTVTTTDPLNSQKRATYDAFDRLLTQTDALGKVTTYAYNTANRTVTVTTPEGVVTVTTANRHGETVSITDGRGNTTSYQYDLNGNLFQTDAPAAGSTVRHFDGANLLTDTVDAQGTKTFFTYDAANRVLTRTVDYGTGRLNLVTTYGYDAKGRAVSVTDPNNIVTTTQFDLKGQVTSVVVDAGTGRLNLTTTYTYDTRGKTITVTEGDGSANPKLTQYHYDMLGRRDSERVDPNGINATTTYAYDKNGNVVRKTDALGNVTRYTYDADNRLVHTVDALGGVTKNDYDAEGRLVRRTEYFTRISLTGLTDAATAADVAGLVGAGTANDHVKGYVYDGDGREIYCVDSLGGVTQKTYDANGNVVRQVQYFNPISTSTALSQTAVNTALAPDTTNDRVTRTVYDAANRAAYSVDGEGYVTERRFDLVGHEIKRIRYADPYTVADGATMTSMGTLLPTIPATAVVEEAHYDNAGRLFEMVDGAGFVTRNLYDAAGNKTDVIRAYGTAASTVHYAYDAAGRMFEETQGYGSAEAATTRYTLDALGNRTKIIEARGIELAETDSTWALATRKALGYVDSATGSAKLASALSATDKDALRGLYTTTQQFDALGRKTRTTDALGGLTVTTYDAFGNAIKITDPRNNSGYFYFDALNRAVLHVDPESYATQTVYDVFGNVGSTVRYANKITGTVTTGTPPAITPNAAHDETTVNEYDKLSRKTKVTDAESYYEQYVYDAFGNKKSYRNQLGGVTTYTYDRVGNVRSETLPVGGIVNRFEYDARGNRTKQIEASGLPEMRTTTFEYDKLDRQTKKIGEAVHVFDATTSTSTQTASPTEQKKYDARGNLIETIAANGARTLDYYDALERKIAELGPMGALTVWQYNDGKAPTAELRYGDPVALPAVAGGVPPAPVNPANVREKRFTYDANNALVQTLVPSVVLGEQAVAASAFTNFTQDVITKSVYDASGNEVQTIDGRGNSTFRYYDRLGQKILEVDPENYLTRWEYDGAGNVIRETKYANRLSIPPAIASDPAALIANVDTVNPDPAADPDRVSEIDYDRMNRVIERRVLSVEYATVSGTGMPTPGTATSRTQIHYNGLGQITQQIDATGAVSDIGYDVAGRKTKEQGAQFTDFEGALVRPTTDYEYDGLNQVKREIDRGKDGTTETDDRITTYQYDYGFGARLIGQTDPAGATVNYAYDLGGNIASRSRVRTNADNVSVTDRVNYSYDLLGHETLHKDLGTNQVDETQYNVYGEITGKRTNGGGAGGAWQEVAAYDKLGRVWKDNSGDGTYKVYLYDANGNSTLTIQSAGPDFSALTLDGVMALSGDQKFLTISQYDARNKLIGTFQPKMSSSHEQAAIEQFITQTAGVNFTAGSASVGALLPAGTKPKVDPVAVGSAGVLKPGSVSASLTLRFTEGGYSWGGGGSEGGPPLPGRQYTNPLHTFSLNLPDTSALGTGNVRIQFSLAGVPAQGGGPPNVFSEGGTAALNDFWESNLAGYSASFSTTYDVRNPSYTFAEWSTNGATPYIASEIYDTESGNYGVAYFGAYYGPYAGGFSGRAYSYAIYKQTDYGEIFLGAYSGSTPPSGAFDNQTTITAASWNSGAAGTGREVDFRGQPGSPQGPATRLILQTRPTGSTGAWTITSVPQKVINGSVAQGWFAFDWNSWAYGSYEFRYTTMDAAGTVTNSESGTMVLSDSAPSFSQTAQQIGGAGRAFMASDGKLHILEQGSSAQTLTIRYRHVGSTEPWSAPAAVPQYIAGMPGWFVFTPTGLTGNYEYWIEAKNASGVQVNRALGNFTVGNAGSVTPLTAYQDLPDIVHFMSQPGSAATMKFSYRTSGSTGAYTIVWLTKVGTGAFDWDATGLVNRLANYGYEYQYETYDGANALVNKAHGTLQLGASPTMLTHLNDSLPSIVSFSPPQTNATKLVLSYRNAGSTGAFTAVTLTRADTSQPFTWDAGPLGTVTLDYFYELFDSLNAPVRSADGNVVHVDGTLTLGATSAPTALKWVVVGTSIPDWSIHRTQGYDAFGEVTQETDGLGRVTNLAYNRLGLLVQKQAPETDITLANGFVQRGRPTTRYAYDLAGRLVTTTDANGNVNSLQLVAGTGVGGGEAQTLTEFHADGGTKLTAYDIFSDARTLTDELGRVTKEEYDKLGRLTRMIRPARGANTPGNETASAVSALDSFGYDQASNRITRTNAQGSVEKTYYDSLGKVVQDTSFSGDITTYSYSYDAAILGAGAVQVGGWLKTTTDGTGRTLLDKQDVFGHTTWHQDLGGHQFTYSYNKAGWLIAQTSTSGQNILYNYYANGYLKSIDDRATGALTKYEYDVEGNRTLEAYSLDLGGGNREYYQEAQVTYDELNRVKSVLDPKAEIRYEYDANSNRRRVWSYYHDGVDGSPQVQDYWYAYDTMDRFVVTMGQLSGTGARGASATDTTVSVVKGSTGAEIFYNRASERTAAVYGSDGHREDYTYTADGYLEDTSINGVLRARRFNDIVGNVVKYQEYNAAGAASFGRTSSYDADSKVTGQTEYNGAIGGQVSTSTTYDYLDAPGTNNNAGPLAVTTLTQVSTNPNLANTIINSYYNYDWWDSGKELDITAQPFNPQVHNWLSGFSHFEYDVNGNLKQVDDVMAGRAIRFVTDAEGLILVRDEISGGSANAQGVVTNAGTIDKHHEFYYFDGKRIGDVGNDGPLKVSYAEELARDRNVSRKDAYKNWKPVSSADFDQNFEPIGPSYPGTAPSLYTVRTGDTLRSIALAVWGDGDLWYILADANGLSGSTNLVAGQTLTIPNKVTNIHNTSETFRVYNAGEIIGDTSPSLPDAPPAVPLSSGKKKKHGFLSMIAAIIAIVVISIVAPELIGPLTNMMATTFGVSSAPLAAALAKGAAFAVAGAVGSMASQTFSIMAGIQDDFSFKAVASSAITSGIGAGLGSFLGASTGPLSSLPEWARTATTVAASGAATQGVSMALGLQQKFDWRGVAASAMSSVAGEVVGAAVGDFVGSAVGGIWGASAGAWMGGFSSRLASGVVGQQAQRFTGARQEMDYYAIAGDAIGGSLADDLNYNARTALSPQIQQTFKGEAELGPSGISGDRAYAWRDDAMREQGLNRAIAALTPQSIDDPDSASSISASPSPEGGDYNLNGLTQIAQVPPAPVQVLTGKTMIDAGTAGLMQTPGYPATPRRPEDNLLITPADPKPSLSQQIEGFLSDGVKNIKDFILGTPAEPVNTPQSIIINKEVEKVGPGRLTPEEAQHLQDIADRFNTTLEVSGSRARGEGRFIDQPDREVGDKDWHRSDIDVRYDGQVEQDTGGRLSEAIMQVGNGAGKANSGTLGLYELPKDWPRMTFKPQGSR